MKLSDDMYGEYQEIFDSALSVGDAELDSQERQNAWSLFLTGFVDPSQTEDARDESRARFFNACGIDPDDFDWGWWRETYES